MRQGGFNETQIHPKTLVIRGIADGPHGFSGECSPGAVSSSPDDHRFNGRERFHGNVAQDVVLALDLTPGRGLGLADFSAPLEHVPTGAPGVEAASRGRVEGAGNVAAQADRLLLGPGVGDGRRREQGLCAGGAVLQMMARSIMP